MTHLGMEKKMMNMDKKMEKRKVTRVMMKVKKMNQRMAMRRVMKNRVIEKL